MTALTRPVKRETAVYERRRALVIVCHARHIEIREKGRRSSAAVDYGVLYDFGRKLQYRQQQAEKAAAKKAGKARR